MEGGLMDQLTHWNWFALAVILATADVIFGASFFLLWMGLSALTVALILWVLPSLIWQYQVLIFAVQSIASIIFWNMYLKKNPPISDKPRLNRRSEQYIDRVFTLEEPIVNGRGKITVEDSSWRVEGEDMPSGTRVVVEGVDGVILKVKKADQ